MILVQILDPDQFIIVHYDLLLLTLELQGVKIPPFIEDEAILAQDSHISCILAHLHDRKKPFTYGELLEEIQKCLNESVNTEQFDEFLVKLSRKGLISKLYGKGESLLYTFTKLGSLVLSLASTYNDHLKNKKHKGT